MASATSRGGESPAGPRPLATWALAAAAVLGFLWQVDLPGASAALARGELLAAAQAHLEESVQRGGVIPFEILTLQDVERRDLVPPPLTVLTALFLHGGPWHLLSNLLFLWAFGRAIEARLGRLRFLALYLGAGVAAALLHVATAALTGTLLVPMVGASGAVAGVLAAWLVLLPRARLRLPLPAPRGPAALPARWLVLAWLALQLLPVVLGAGSGEALFAHLGGFAAGLPLAWRLGRGRRAPGGGTD